MAVVVVVLITGVNLVIVVFLALVVMAHVILVVTLLLFQLCSGANIQYTDQEYNLVSEGSMHKGCECKGIVPREHSWSAQKCQRRRVGNAELR